LQGALAFNRALSTARSRSVAPVATA
jgi:hypothetical protein